MHRQEGHALAVAAPLADVVADADEQAAPGQVELADAQVQREAAAVLAPPHALAPHAADAPLAIPAVALQRVGVGPGLGLRQQQRHAAPEQFVLGEAEAAQGRAVNRLDQALLVADDYRVDRRLEGSPGQGRIDAPGGRAVCAVRHSGPLNLPHNGPAKRPNRTNIRRERDLTDDGRHPVRRPQ